MTQISYPAHVMGHVTFLYAVVCSIRSSVQAFLCLHREALLDYVAGVWSLKSYFRLQEGTGIHIAYLADLAFTIFAASSHATLAVPWQCSDFSCQEGT